MPIVAVLRSLQSPLALGNLGCLAPQNCKFFAILEKQTTPDIILRKVRVKMFKILFIIGLIALPIKIGFESQKRFQTREKNLFELCNFLSSARREVIYSRRRLHEIFKENLYLLTGRLKQNFIDNLDCIPKHGLEGFFQKINLNSLDKKLILTFANDISKSDEAFENLILALQANLKIAKTENEQNGKLWRSLGIASGLILGILFI